MGLALGLGLGLGLMASIVPKTRRSMRGASAGDVMAAYCEGSME